MKPRSHFLPSIAGILVWALMSAPGMLYGWTDTIDSTVKIRAVHITELRTAVNAKRAEYGFSTFSGWTDPTITAGTTLIRKSHIDELRDKLDDINAAFQDDCPVVPAPASWGAITAGSSLIRAGDITQLRDVMDAIGTARDCCGFCRKGNGVTCVDQTASEDLWSACPYTVCQDANCNGAGDCSNLAPASHGSEGGWGSNCALCEMCDGNGNCVDQHYKDDLWVECSGGTGGITCGYCDGSGACENPGTGTGGKATPLGICKQCQDGSDDWQFVKPGTDPLHDCECNGLYTQICDGAGSCVDDVDCNHCDVSRRYTLTCVNNECAMGENCNKCNGLQYTQTCYNNACENKIDCWGGSGGFRCGYCSGNACYYRGHETWCSTCHWCEGTDECVQVPNGTVDPVHCPVGWVCRDGLCYDPMGT